MSQTHTHEPDRQPPAPDRGAGGRVPIGRVVLLLILLALLLAGLAAATTLGSTGLALSEVVEALGRRGLLGTPEATPADNIVWNVRLPRAILSVLVGLNLAVAGVLLQGIMRNPLASPGIIGVTAGAALFATLAMLAVPAMAGLAFLEALSLPTMAFVGAVLVAAVVYAMSWQPGLGTSPTRMILAGVAVTAMVGAMQSFLAVYFADRIGGVMLWLAGSLNARSWHQLPMIWPFSIGGLGLALAIARPLNLLQMGEDSARSLGVGVQQTRALAIVAAALLTASAVSVAGIVGFVGLVVPHILRYTLSHNHRWLIPGAALGGAVLVCWADVFARILGEMPVGVLTAAIGGPYFVFLLYKTRLI